MRVAITGATGFLGRHVLAALAETDVDIVALSRRDSADLPHLPRLDTLHCDIASDNLPSYDDIGRPDLLIHLAWDGLPNYLSCHHFETELPAQYRFLSGLVRSGLKNFTVTGTCFEYGMVSGPLREDMVSRPCNPYGFAKDVLRQQLEFLKSQHSFTLTWARLFYMYGSGQNPKSLFSLLRAAIESHEDCFDMSEGDQLRDFIKAEDAARFIVELALMRADVGIVNVCSGKPISVRRQVERWLAENRWHIRLNLGRYPYPSYEPMAFWGDNEKLNSLRLSRACGAAPNSTGQAAQP